MGEKNICPEGAESQTRVEFVPFGSVNACAYMRACADPSEKQIPLMSFCKDHLGCFLLHI